jgi:hypothetical protein
VDEGWPEVSWTKERLALRRRLVVLRDRPPDSRQE